MSWFVLRVEPRDRDAVISRLFEAGAQGLEEREDGLLAYFSSSDCAEAAATDVGPLVLPGHAIEPVAVTDWTVAWRSGVRAITLGRLTIAPPWLASDFDPSTTVVIDPGMAFGTGEHASTRGALRLLQAAGVEGVDVADLGAGSAVLSIAAARLGARRVYAIESDSDAMLNASENIERNGVNAVVHLLDGEAAVVLPLVAPVDVVVANIISGVLADLLPDIRRALRRGGRAILAGLLQEERPAWERRLAADCWISVSDDSEGDWWSVLIQSP